MADVGRLGLADIDNDGDLDFAMGVSHDGRLDVATVEQQDITWHISVSPRWIIWEQLDGNHWEENVVIDNGMAGHDMACGDVDGDGDPDLVAKVWNAYAADSGTWGTEEPEYVSYIENTTECVKKNSVKDR